MVITVGTHQKVQMAGVAGWKAGVHCPGQRFEARCDECGLWRGPTPQAVHDSLISIPCRLRR
jgi:hypothetical protein